jgi:hypothetical protein
VLEKMKARLLRKTQKTRRRFLIDNIFIMTPKEQQRWCRIRGKGLIRFILLYGILGWSLVIIGSFVIAHSIFNSRIPDSDDFSRTHPMIYWGTLTVFSLCFGVISALWRWSNNEERFTRSNLS